MRPQVDDETAEVVAQLAEELTEIDAEMLTFNQQLRVVLKNIDDIEFSKGNGRNRRTTEAGRIVGQLN